MFRKLKENLNTFVGEFFNTYYFNLNYSLSNIRPRLVKNLVILRFYVIILMCATVVTVTVFSRIEAAASICFLYFLVRFLFEGGFYSRAASIYRNSLSVIHQMALFRNFFFKSRVIM